MTTPRASCAACERAFTMRAEGQRCCSIACSVTLTRRASNPPLAPVEEPPPGGAASVAGALTKTRESVARMLAEGRRRRAS